MREGAWVLIAMLILATPLAAADVFEVEPLVLASGLSFLPTHTRVCELRMDRANHIPFDASEGTYDHLNGRRIYLSSESCTSLNNQNVINWHVRDWRVTHARELTQETLGNRVPLTTEFGVAYFEDDNNNWLNNDMRKPAIGSGLHRITDQPTTDYTLQSGSVCAEELTLEFRGYNYQIDPEGEQFFEATESEDHYASCIRMGMRRPIIPDDAGFGSPIIRESFQGWQKRDLAQPNVKLPVHCGDIRFNIRETQSSDWDMKKTYLLSQEDPSERRVISGINSNDNNWFTITFDNDNGTISGWTLQMVDHSGAVGGFNYDITCIDPLGPDDRQDICTAQDGDYASTAAGGRCCLAEREGEIIVEDGVSKICTGGIWQHGVIDCARGQKTVTDPTSYCCTDGMQGPHLYEDGEYRGDGWPQPYTCDNGILESTPDGITADQEWAHNGMDWKRCTTQATNSTHGDYRCDGERWTRVQAFEGAACRATSALFSHATEESYIEATEETIELPYTTACFMGTLHDERQGPEPITYGGAP